MVLMKKHIMTPDGSHSRDCDTTYPCSHFTKDTYLSHVPSNFKKISD